MRRTALVVAVMALATVAVEGQDLARVPAAQSGQDGLQRRMASRAENIFQMFMAAHTSGEAPDKFWTQQLAADLSATEVRKLSDYANRVYTGNIKSQDTELGNICARKSSLQSAESVASALTRFDAANRANQEKFGNEAARALGDRLNKLLIAAADRSRGQIIEYDHKKLMTAMKKDPKETISNFCVKSSGKAGP